MAVTLDSGWESSGGSDITDGGKWTGTTITGSGVTPSVSSSNPFHGTYKCICSTVGGGGESKCYKTFDSQDIVYARWYVKIDVMPDNGNTLYLGTLFGSTEYMNVHIYRTGTSYYWGLDRSGDSLNETSASNPVIDTWYCIEFLRDNTNNVGKVWINGTLLVNWATSVGEGNIKFDCGIAYSSSSTSLSIDVVTVSNDYTGYGSNFTKTITELLSLNKKGI